MIPRCSFFFLIVVLIYISVIMMLSIFLCAFWPSVCLLWKNVCLDLPIFWFLLCQMSCLEIIPCQLLFALIYSHSEGCRFILLMVSFAVQKLLTFTSHLFIFIFIFITLGGGSKQMLLQFMSETILPLFFWKIFLQYPALHLDL